MTQLNGSDLSHHNGVKDVGKVPGDFVILKASEGLTADDATFPARVKQAVASGKLVGAYHYMHKNGGEKEAKHFLDVVGQYKNSITLWLDFEDGHDTLAEAVKFLDYVNAHAKGSAGIYISRSYENTGKYNAFKGYPLWLAQYNNYEEVVGFQPRKLTGAIKYLGSMTVFQYTSSGKLKGVTGDTDLDVFYGDRKAWEKLAGGASTKKASTAAAITSAKKTIGSIATVQTWLNFTYHTGLEVDDVYGTATKKALIKALQTELNKQFGAHLTVDGIWGAKTAAACRNVKKGAKGNLTRILQGMLICYGYSTNGFDGIFGTGTYNAVIKFQKAKGLSADAIAGKGTFTKLAA